jgi:hypothetical protein
MINSIDRETGNLYNYKMKNTSNEDNPLSLKAAIKAYYDEKLTGLTDEEKAKIEEECKAYLEANPIENESDVEAFNRFVESLFRKYGFKGDVRDAAAAFAAGMTGDGDEAGIADSESQAAKAPVNNAALNKIAAMDKIAFEAGLGYRNMNMEWPLPGREAEIRRTVERYERNSISV